MYKKELALKTLQWLICRKTKPIIIIISSSIISFLKLCNCVQINICY